MTDPDRSDLSIEDLLADVAGEAADWDPNDLPESQQRLHDDLEAAGAPEWLLEKVRAGKYHDYASDVPMPKTFLVTECERVGLDEVAFRARRGDYDP